MSDTRPHKVAIVDDDHDARESLQFLLEVAGHVVQAFASAAEFLKSAMHDVACLIVDHHMPEVTGLELVEKLRADGNAMPILLVTGAPTESIYARAANLGVERVLEKPLDEGALLEFISRSVAVQ